MMYIDKTSPKINKARKEHYNGLIDKLYERFDSIDDNFSKEIFDKYINTNLESIIIGEPVILKKLSEDIKLFYKNPQFLKSIKHVFKYEGWFDGKQKTVYNAYNLAKNLDIPTCVYCNRMYTKTVIDNEGLIRPTFDHYFSKEEHPLLALSFYNLIPCCTICNSSIKRTKELFLDKHFHPYVSDRKDINKQIKFSYYNRSLDSYGFTIKSPKNSKGEKTVEFFKLKEIYEAHEDEISDLARLRYAYSETYLKDLRDNIMKNAISEKEVYRLAFGTYIEESEFHKRPLSKMKRDILSELGILKHFKK